VRKPDLDDLQARVAARTGLAHPGAVSRIEPGAVFEVADTLVRFPGDRPRTWHDFRRVIVVQAYNLLGPVDPETVSVVPCSASQQRVRRGDYLVPAEEKAFSRPEVVAFSTLIMPVLKSALTSDGYRGVLSPEAYGGLLARIAANLGAGPWVAMPPRA
jgi:hypothetical protein